MADGIPRRRIEPDPMARLFGKFTDLDDRLDKLERGAPLRNASISGGQGLQALDTNNTPRVTITGNDGAVTALDATGSAVARFGPLLASKPGAYGVEVNVDGTWIQLGAQVATWGNLSGKPASFPPSSHTHDASDVSSGTISRPVSTTTVAASGTVSGATVSGTNVNGTNVRASAAPGTNIGTTRVAAWLQSSDGLLGTAASSRRYKQDIRPASIDPKAVLSIIPKLYHFRSEVAKRDDPTAEGYVGPSYRVANELGVIAEELHDAGLWQFVIYQRDLLWEEREDPVLDDEGAPLLDEDGDPVTETIRTCVGDKLRLDEAGEPIPEAVHYELLALALFPVVQEQESRLSTLETTTRTQAEQIEQLTAAVRALGGNLT